MTHGLRLHDPGQKPGAAKRALIKIKRKCQEKGPLRVSQAAGLTSGPHRLRNGDRAPSTQGPRVGVEIVSSRKCMGRAGGGAEALCAQSYLQGFLSAFKTCHPKSHSPGSPPRPDSVEKLPRDWGLWPRVSGFLVMRPNQDQGKKTDSRP